MTRRDQMPWTTRPVNVVAPGNEHLIRCECGHLPDHHIAGVGCIAVVEVVDRWTGGRQSLGEDFCPCTSYEVAP
jgi:hypothetical protein